MQVAEADGVEAVAVVLDQCGGVAVVDGLLVLLGRFLACDGVRLELAFADLEVESQQYRAQRQREGEDGFEVLVGVVAVALLDGEFEDQAFESAVGGDALQRNGGAVFACAGLRTGLAAIAAARAWARCSCSCLCGACPSPQSCSVGDAGVGRDRFAREAAQLLGRQSGLAGLDDELDAVREMNVAAVR